MTQEDKRSFLPYFFTEPVFFIKEEHAKMSNTKEKLRSEPTADIADASKDVMDKGAKNIEKESLAKPAPHILPIQYAGKNLKKILFLFENKEAEGLPVKEELFLKKVLQAVNLNFDDIALINIAFVEDVAYSQINAFDALVQISLGVQNESLFFNASRSSYSISRQEDRSYLLTDDLTTLQNHQDKKVLLWKNLQQLFIV